ncbi:L-lactate permease [Klebsiella pneumoniae]|nr:L-lactate permease [Klebsiella pneumoniae]
MYKFDWLSATGNAILFRRPAVHRLAAHEAERCADHLRAGTLKDLALPIHSSAWCWRSPLSLTIPGCRRPWFLRWPPYRPRVYLLLAVPWLAGGILTGSDTSSNAPFAALQATAVQQIGVSDILLVAANTTGGVTGKMISPQSIAIACAAVGLVGKESDLFRLVVKQA